MNADRENGTLSKREFDLMYTMLMYTGHITFFCYEQGYPTPVFFIMNQATMLPYKPMPVPHTKLQVQQGSIVAVYQDLDEIYRYASVASIHAKLGQLPYSMSIKSLPAEQVEQNLIFTFDMPTLETVEDLNPS